MSKSLFPVRIALDLSCERVIGQRLQPDGSVQQAHASVADSPLADGVRAVLSALVPAGAAAIEVIVASERPLQHWLRGTLPQVALLATAGVERHLGASLATPSAAPLWFPRALLAGGEDVGAPLGTADDLWGDGAALGKLCPASHVVAVDERCAADGAVVRALSGEETARAVADVAALGVQAAAVVLLHSPQNEAHEARLVEALTAQGIAATASAQLLPASHGGQDERLRARAAVLDAALSQICGEDLDAVRRAVPAGVTARILCMDSSGRACPVAQVAPWRRMIGGMAAGLVGAARIASGRGYPRFALVMAGDVAGGAGHRGMAALCDARPETWERGPVTRCAGVPVEFPALAVLAADALGHSASADVGGGLDAALEDALSELALRRGLSGLELEEKEDSDGRPHYPPVLVSRDQVAALGALSAKAVAVSSVTLRVEASGAQQSGLVASTLSVLGARLAAGLAESTVRAGSAAGMPAGGTGLSLASRTDWSAELRYAGQSGTLSLRGVGAGGSAASASSDLVVRFVAEHQRVYGFSSPECPVELVALHVTQPLYDGACMPLPSVDGAVRGLSCSDTADWG